MTKPVFRTLALALLLALGLIGTASSADTITWTVTMLTTPESAPTWQVDYSTRGDISQVTRFYGPGAYEFLRGRDPRVPEEYITVYLNTGPVNGSQGGFQFIGFYDDPPAAVLEILARNGQYPGRAVVPAEIPPIVFTGLFDDAIAYMPVGDQSMFFGNGTYLLLTTAAAPQTWQVYLLQTNWIYQGVYGSTAILPETFPTLTLIEGYNIFAVPTVTAEPPPPILGGPVTKDECKHSGWETFQFPRAFKNQGDCIQFVNTGR